MKSEDIFVTLAEQDRKIVGRQGLREQQIDLVPSDANIKAVK